MRRRVLILVAILGFLVCAGATAWFVVSHFLLPKTSLYGIQVTPKMVDFTKIPWRYAGPGNVFEVPTMDVEEIAKVLVKEGFKDQGPGTTHLYSNSQDGPYVLVDSRDFERDLGDGATETVAIMKSEGVRALVHFQTQDMPNQP
ncbi:MAG: hypothetical protein GC165_15510 [Armatimonadetes bacterium]|nr:hypothetical protein [Armatimonadota bacterium]